MAISQRAPARANIALAVIVTCQLMVVLDASVVNIALTPIQHALHFSPASLSWVIDAYSLTFGGLLLLGGRAGDIFGRRRMLIIGLTIFTVASLAGGLSTTAAMLVVTRAIQGIGAALAAPSTLSLISATFEEGHARNRALGIFTAASAGGGSLGLILGGALTSWASWRWVLFINVPIGIAIIALTPRFVPEPPRNGGRLDVGGAVLVTGGLGSLIYGFIRIGETGSDAGITAAIFVASVALLTAFVFVERRTRQPLVPLRLLVDRTRSRAYLDMLLLAAGMFGMFFFISQFLETGLHYSALRTGLAFLPLTALIFTMSRVTPRLVGRFGPRPLILIGISLVTAALAWISQVSATSGYLTGIFGPLVLFGFGAGLAFLPLSVTILSGVPRNDAGAASGLLQTMQQTGAALGVAVLVSVAGSHGQSDALLVGAAFAAVGLVLAITMPRARRSPGASGGPRTGGSSDAAAPPLAAAATH